LSYFFVDAVQFADLLVFLPTSQDVSGLTTRVPIVEPKNDISDGNFDRLFAALNGGDTLRLKINCTQLPTNSLAGPIRIYLEICLRCNANCNYCLNKAGSARLNELSTEELLRTIENFGRDGVFEVRLTGGETTLHPDFYEIAQSVWQNGMALSVNSNLLINKTKLDKLIKLSPQLLITSLDAAEKPHTNHRGNGYQYIVKNVRILREAGVPLRLNCAINRDTLSCIEGFIDEFAPLGCGFCFILLRPTGRAVEKFDPPPLSEIIPVIRIIEEKKQKYAGVYFSTSFHVVMERELTISGINLTGCNAIQKSFNVNSDGTVLPCAFLFELSPEKFTLGNIRNNNYSILEIWSQSELLRALRKRSSNCNMRCIGCSRFKHDCLGTCVFMELYSELSGKPDPYCKISTEISSLA